jgi:hypothetical protein
MKISLLSICYAISLTACSSNISQGIYESIKAQNDAKRSPQERVMTPAPSYDEYKKERENTPP